MYKKMIIVFAIYFIILYILEFISNLETTLDFRIKQNKDILNNNKQKEKIIRFFERKEKHTKKYDLETLSLQAGYNLKYGEIIFYKLVVALITGVVLGIILKNPFMGVVFMFVGFSFPNIFLENKKNSRYTIINEQIGPMMYMLNKRYESTSDFVYALELTRDEYVGIEPIHSELEITINEIAATGEIKQSLDNLARRTGSYYLQLLSDYFEIAYELGSENSKKLLNQAYLQFEEDRKMKELLDIELDEVVRESYLMIGAVPVFGIFSAVFMPDFIPVVTGTIYGKVTITVISIFLVGCIWAVNKFVNAPLE